MIEGVCPNSPFDVVYKMISYMQRWRALLRGEEQAKMEVKLQQVGGWMKGLQEQLRRSTQGEDVI
jgi:hypothetical protein